MALNSSKPKGGLVFKKRGQNDLKKIMIFGLDGSGKSTFAEKYCKEHNLHPVCIDIDDTNFTNVPIVEIDTSSDLMTFRSMKETIDLIAAEEQFDTIIIDGVTSLLEMLVSKGKGLSKYSDRAERFQDLLRKIQTSGKNIIWIGQADMEVIYNADHQSNKQVIKINSMVNEKYRCIKTEKGEYTYEVVKFRTATGKTEVDDNPLRELCLNIQRELESEGIKVTKSTMKSKVVKDIKAGFIEESLRPDLIKYIQKHCPEELN